MADDLLNTTEAARRLGITRATLYQWLGESTHGNLVIRGTPVAIEFFQSGRKGQGRIRISADEVERLKQCMKVVPRRISAPSTHSHPTVFPGITVPLGRPKR